MLGGIEAGGTKFICGIGNGPEDLVRAQFITTTPEATLNQAIGFFQEQAGRKLEAVGIGSFGPVDLDRKSPTYGYITSTPKPGWENFDLAGSVSRALQVPVGFDTDVNGAILSEARWGAAQGISDALYLTVGTGIGGGALVNGQVAHGLLHPEMGHLRLPHDFSKDPFPGACPYHGDCLEGMASGPAMQKRWGSPAGALPPDHPAWQLEAHYLALALVNLAVTLSPRRILLGGGVMQQPHLFKMIRTEFSQLLNGYVRHPDILDHLDEYIQPPKLGNDAGILGALLLAEMASTALVMTSNAVGGRA
ncbi:MAG TPA: ROK family protein [Bryobacteraceae bacterium]|nr:ROK family protein [Bryobacteraceae bacterium]